MRGAVEKVRSFLSSAPRSCVVTVRGPASSGSWLVVGCYSWFRVRSMRRGATEVKKGDNGRTKTTKNAKVEWAMDSSV